MKITGFFVLGGLALNVCVAPAQPALKLKRYFALKVKPFNQSMFAAQDRKGNYYLAGTTSSTEFGFSDKDWLVAKFSPAGVRLWYRTFNGKGNGGDIPGGIVVDRLGNVIVCGYTTGVAQEGSAGAVVKWDSNGNRKHVRYSPGTASAGFEYDDYRAIAVDYLNNIYVTGSRTGTPASGVDLLVEKLSPALTPIWSKTWSQVGHPRLEQGLSIDLHANGTVFIGGDAPTTDHFAGGFWVFTSQGANTKFIRYLGKDGFGRVSRIRAMGNRVYVFGDIRGTGFLANEGTLFSNVYTSSGSVIFNRLTIGNSTISRNSIDGAVGPDGSFANFCTTSVSGNQADTLTQRVLYGPSGVFTGLTSANLPKPAYAEGGFLFGGGAGSMLYKTFANGSNRIFSAPIADGVLKSGQAVVLNLPGQNFDRPTLSPLGETLLPYTQNGAAGVRAFEVVNVWASFQAEEARRGRSIRVHFHGRKTVGSTRLRVRIYIAGQEQPFREWISSFTEDQDEPGITNVAVPPSVPVGGYLFMTVEEVNFEDKPVGPASTSFVPIVG